MPRAKINWRQAGTTHHEVAQMTTWSPMYFASGKKIPHAQPSRSRGNRIYQKHDIELLNQIKQLLTKRITLLKEPATPQRHKATDERKELLASAKLRTLIGEIKREIESLLKLFLAFWLPPLD